MIRYSLREEKLHFNMMTIYFEFRSTSLWEARQELTDEEAAALPI